MDGRLGALDLPGGQRQGGGPLGAGGHIDVEEGGLGEALAALGEVAVPAGPGARGGGAEQQRDVGGPFEGGVARPVKAGQGVGDERLGFQRPAAIRAPRVPWSC